jgi:hypothetical protein
LGENSTEFAKTHKFVVMTNHKPKVPADEEGVWRRLRLIPFMQTVWNPDHPARPGEVRPDHLRQDKELLDLLKAEAEGILTWLVRGCLAWQAEGLGTPPAVTAATESYRAEADLLSRFIAERCVTGPKYKVKAKDLRKAYADFARDLGEVNLPSDVAFGKHMASKGYPSKQSNGATHFGLRLPRVVEPGDGQGVPDGLLHGVDAEVHRADLAGQLAGDRRLSRTRQAAEDDEHGPTIPNPPGGRQQDSAFTRPGRPATPAVAAATGPRYSLHLRGKAYPAVGVVEGKVVHGGFHVRHLLRRRCVQEGGFQLVDPCQARHEFADRVPFDEVPVFVSVQSIAHAFM